jgi:Phosphoesterase family
MPRSVPRWLYLLICLAIIIVVGGVVFFSARATRQTPGDGAATATPHSALVPIISPTATVQANLIAPTPTAVAGNKTVFLTMMENHNWSDIKNSPSAPYINHTLLPMASYAEQYYNPPGNHPSEPNYLWLEAGTNFGISDDANPGVNHQGTTQHLVTLLNNAHISWKSYQESISGTVCPLTGNSYSCSQA